MIYRPNRNEEWHPFFAWYPVYVGSGIAWLHKVERRWNQTVVGCWEYREVNEKGRG